MKNLMIYIHPSKRFDAESEMMIRIQIDNSTSLGWKTEDIFLVTNFKFKYKNISANIVPDNLYCSFYKQGSKVNTLNYLFNKSYIIENETYWLHDLDAFETHSVNPVIGLNNSDMGLTRYGRMNRFNTGSIFFKKSSIDIVREWESLMNKTQVGDESAFNTIAENFLDNRVTELNVSYNLFSLGNIKFTYEKIMKPIRVVHFHPFSQVSFDSFSGKNEINFPLVPSTLLKMFEHYGVKPS